MASLYNIFLHRLPPKDCQWIKFNVGQLGYYRVNYPDEDWTAFGDLLSSNLSALSASDRTSLLNDVFSLAKAGRVSYKTALNLVKYLRFENALGPWSTALSQLNKIAGLFYYTDGSSMYNKFIVDLVLPIYEQLQWEEKKEATYDRTLLRPLVIHLLCEMGNEKCLNIANQKFRSWKDNGDDVPVDLRNNVYGHGMSLVGDFDTWTWMLNRYKAETNPQEKIKLMRGLASIRVPWILHHLIELARDTEVFRGQDYFTLLHFISMNRVGESIVWDFYRNEWDYLVERFTLNDRIFGRFVTTVTGRFCTERRLQEMNHFFAAHPDAGAGANYRKIALETVESNILFIKSKLPEIKHWLKEQQKL